MSIFQIVNNYFIIKIEFMDNINAVLTHYKNLIQNRCSTDSIDLLINNWTKSTAENNPDKLNNISQLQLLKLTDPLCDNITSFKTIYHNTYITNQSLMLLQMLIDKYYIDAKIVKNALLNLLPVVKLLCQIDSVTTLSWHRLVFKKKLSNIDRFINLRMYDIIFREVYFAYLIQQRDNRLFHRPKHSTTTSVLAICAKQDTSVNLLDDDIPNLILHPYITEMSDINCIRSVSKDLYLHYNSETMKGIAIRNLKEIVTNFFMISADDFTTALLSCGAILGGSIVAQSFHGGSNKVFKNSDADLYVPEMNDFTALEDLILKSGYELYSTDAPSLLGDDTHFYSEDVLYTFNSSILFVGNYKNKMGRKVQIIKIRSPADVLTTLDFGRFVVHSYDLTFLKNFFDGINLYTADFVGVVRKIGSVTQFVKSACTVSSLTAQHLNLLSNWYRSITATIIRCLKYQQRGFHIDNVPETNLVTELGVL